MKRGDIVIVSAPGSYGKPRLAVIVQSDGLKFTGSVLVALVTSDVADAPLFRLTLEPIVKTGLKTTSQIMIDKIMAVPREKCSAAIGKLDKSNLGSMNSMLSIMIGLAD